MKPRVYVETSIISYLTARPSRDLILAANQQSTREWWARRHGYELFVAPLVVLECQAGDVQAAAARLEALVGLPVLEQSDATDRLAMSLLGEVPLPERAKADAIHIATAAVHAIDYLLTWNCRHIANPLHQRQIHAACVRSGFQPPVIRTPQDFLGEDR